MSFIFGMSSVKRKVLVLGAGGKTGSIVLQKLHELFEGFEVIGGCRTAASAEKMKQETGAETVVCDLTQPESVAKAMKGIRCLIVLSSATPQLDWFKLLGELSCCLCSKLRGGGMNFGNAFGYKDGGYPEQVDWQGGKAAIDAAKEAGVRQVIYVGSMGGTKSDHFLNKMGNGDILLWKRKAERYLVNSGLRYTIIHPGGLLPHPGVCGDGAPVRGGKRELVAGINDALMDGPKELRCIPREDLAEVVVQCAKNPSEGQNRVFDLTSKDPAAFPEAQIWDGSIKNLLREVGTYDYSMPDHPILGA